MGPFQCYICSLISESQDKINVHMKFAHSINLDDEDQMSDKYLCPLCKYTTRNMANFKNHMISSHQKDKWNWTLEIKSIIYCEDCQIEFPQKSMLRIHIESKHTDVSNAISHEVFQKIEPDQKFLTRNTKDLEEMLKSIPKHALNTEEDEFQEDFNTILNNNKKESVVGSDFKAQCTDCNFRAASKHVLRTHFIFVHDTSFHTCQDCGRRTKTTEAMNLHKASKHKSAIFASSESQADSDESEYEDDDDVPEPYQMKKWDCGYNFKSRAVVFHKATTNLKSLLRKCSKEKCFGGVKLRVLEVTKEGGGKLAKIEIIDKAGNGEVKMQSWGPSTKTKEITIQISKSSKGELKHVETLALKVVKPLLDKLLSGVTVKSITKNTSVTVDTKHDSTTSLGKNNACPMCNKCFKTEGVMKGHITRMHKVLTPNMPKMESRKHTENNHETGQSSDSEADRSVYKCDKCNFKTINKTKFKKHKKSHVNSSKSNSPEKKKQKLSEDLSKAIVDDILEKIHDSDSSDKGSETDKKLKKFDTVSFEEKRMDEQLMDHKVEKKTLSDKNDQKILEKRKKADEKEAEEQKARNLRLLQSQEKTKRMRELSQQVKKKDTNVKSAKLPQGFNEIPGNLMKHFPKDHVILKIKPDGLCGVSCGAGHIFGDPNLSKEFRRRINKHFVSHWEYYKDKINFPYRRQVGVDGKTVDFCDPLDFQNFLQTEDADFLWTDGEEIHAMCNQYSMTATVVRISEDKNSPPSINQVGPDPDILKLGLPNTSNVGSGIVPNMFLLLQGGHYDLVVARQSIGEKFSPTEKEKGYEAEEEGSGSEKEEGGGSEDEEESTENNPKNMEEKLKDMEDKYTRLKQSYTRSLSEIKFLKAKLETKDVEARSQNLSDNDSDNDYENDAKNLAKSKCKGYRKTTPQSEPEENLKCTVCKLRFLKTGVLKNHMKIHNEDGDWTCGDLECSFQAKSENQLKAHKNVAHPDVNQPEEDKDDVGWQKARGGDVHPNKWKGSYSCKMCGKDFIYKIDMTKHIKETHKTYKPCRDMQSCSYKDSRNGCRYNHKVYPDGHQVCFECGNSFKTVHDLMRHRKCEHKVPICKEFLANRCDFSASDCYYTHKKHQNPLIPDKSQSEPQTQGFWEGPPNPAPPSQGPKVLEGPTHAEWITMKNMLTQLNQMVSKFQ